MREQWGESGAELYKHIKKVLFNFFEISLWRSKTILLSSFIFIASSLEQTTLKKNKGLVNGE